MASKPFVPPETEAEFRERAKSVDSRIARNMLKALESQRAGMVAEIDQEISFYKRVLKERGEL